MDRPHNTALIRINSDTPCKVMYFGKEILTVGVSDYSEIYLPRGRHRLSFISLENPKDQVSFEKEILDVEYEDIIDVELLPIIEARQNKEQAEAARIQRELAARKAEAERIQKERERQEAERRMLIEASTPYRIQPFSKLKFYDWIEIKRFGFYSAQEHILAKKEGKYSILNSNDFLPVFPFIYSSIQECHGSGSRIWLERDKKIGLYSLINRSFIINPCYDYISISDNLVDTIVIVAIGDWPRNAKYGIVDDSGKIIADCKYNFISRSGSGDYECKLGDKYGLLDKTGRVKLPFEHEKLSLFGSRGAYPSIKNGKYGVYNGSGKVILDFIYDKIDYCEPFGCGYHVLIKDGKYGIHVCGTGEMIPCIYNSRKDIPDFKMTSYWV